MGHRADRFLHESSGVSFSSFLCVSRREFPRGRARFLGPLRSAIRVKDRRFSAHETSCLLRNVVRKLREEFDAPHSSPSLQASSPSGLSWSPQAAADTAAWSVSAASVPAPPPGAVEAPRSEPVRKPRSNRALSTGRHSIAAPRAASRPSGTSTACSAPRAARGPPRRAAEHTTANSAGSPLRRAADSARTVRAMSRARRLLNPTP